MYSTAMDTINKYNMINPGEHIIIALSGGADSMSLLYFLNDIKDKYSLILTAVHVNHGIRGKDALADELFVKEACLHLHIKLEIFNYDIVNYALKNKLTEEEAGRKMRYKSFFEMKDKLHADKIAVAHNMNDCAETVLFNICRGSGTKGLCGIPPVRDSIIRPLINCSRLQIEKYCSDNDIKFVNDNTNFVDKYTRNKIRLHLIPWIEREINNGIVKSINKMSYLIYENEQFIDSIVERAYHNCRVDVDEECLYISELIKNDIVIQKRVIRYALNNVKPGICDVNFININDILMLLQKESGKLLNISGGIIVKKSYDNLIFCKQDFVDSSFCYDLSVGKRLFISELNKYVLLTLLKNNNDTKSLKNYTKLFDCDKINFSNIQLRSRNTGDKIYLKGVGNKKLSDFFIDKKIPFSERGCIPLLTDGKDVIWIIGFRISDKYKVSAATINILMIELLGV